MTTWRDKIHATGFILAALGYLLLIIQFAGYWRFGSLDEWAIQATLPGTLEQLCVLSYILITLICLHAKE